MRGQEFDVGLASVAITLVILALVMFVGMQLMTTVDQAALQEFENESDDVGLCNGFAGGCDGSGYGFFDLIHISIIVVAMAVGMSYFTSTSHIMAASSDDGADPKRAVVERYVDDDGDIETVLELESELDDVMDDEDEEER